ncbi:unnamed protein product [Nezara viridula]|uniref:Uncharacterized protein n=1 Tax=Nezara viridula TaxID=85310 RepID=A0A9P0EAI9_NEZVI|nr:unnamed protein product [Nezara viridula]
MWEYRHPDAGCFTALAKPKPLSWPSSGKISGKTPSSEPQQYAGAESPPSQTASIGFFDQQTSANKADDEGWVSSPKDTVFPETIPEESSSTEEEHVVIFRLPSLADSEGLKESSIYTAPDATIFQAPPRFSKSPSDTPLDCHMKHSTGGRRQSSMDKESMASRAAAVESSPAATLLDVAVMRCLFISQWPEEGVYWALQFLYHR